jgi:hypothetical protein
MTVPMVIAKRQFQQVSVPEKRTAGGINTVWLPLLPHRDAATLLRLLETAAFFRPADYNAVFENELAKILPRLHNPDVRQQAMALRGFDWGNYLARSLQWAGFRDDDQQEVFHATVVKLLIKPGRLFSGWNPQRHGPLLARFAVASGMRSVTPPRRAATYSDGSALGSLQKIIYPSVRWIMRLHFGSNWERWSRTAKGRKARGERRTPVS